MRIRLRPALALLCVGSITLTGCSAAPDTPSWTYGPGPETSPRPGAAASVAAVRPVVEVHRSPLCSCCHEWEAYLRAAGWTVVSVDEDDMAAFKGRHQIPESAWSCHTALIDGYVVEGHVPIEAIEQLLDGALDVDGIALAGMPAGSPGMPGTQEAPFEVVSVTDGQTEPFGSY